MAVRERLRIQEPVFYGDDLVVKVVPKWDKCLKVIGGITKNNDTSAGKWAIFKVVMIPNLITVIQAAHVLNVLRTHT